MAGIACHGDDEIVDTHGVMMVVLATVLGFSGVLMLFTSTVVVGMMIVFFDKVFRATRHDRKRPPEQTQLDQQGEDSDYDQAHAMVDG